MKHPLEYSAQFLQDLADVCRTWAEEMRREALASEGGTSDQWLSVKQVAQKIGLSPKYVYEHAAELGFSRRQGRRLMFSERGLEAYMARIAEQANGAGLGGARGPTPERSEEE